MVDNQDYGGAFGVKTQAIIKHLSNIYEEEELTREATCSKKEQVQIEGGREVHRTVDFYNLDAIIAVGYRVNSKKATRFRQWASCMAEFSRQTDFALSVPVWTTILRRSAYTCWRCWRSSGVKGLWISLSSGRRQTDVSAQ